MAYASGLLTGVVICYILYWLFCRKKAKQNAEFLQINEKLANEKFLIERIMESSGEYFLIADLEGQILYTNARTQSHFSWDAAQAPTLMAFFAHIQSHTITPFGLYEQIEAFRLESSRNLKSLFQYTVDGKERLLYEMKVSKLGDAAEGNEVGFLFVFRDSTERERILQIRNELISTVSHELRTPLSSILGFVEILINRDVNADRQKKYFRTIYEEANRLSHLIDDFLDLQRIESGQQKYYPVPIELLFFLEEIVKEWEGKQPQKLQLVSDPAQVFVIGDKQRLHQAINYLISNAVKYSAGTETIVIRFELKQAKVYIHVQDYGLGIPDEAKDKLFTKFYRVDNSDRRQIGGTGLGLSICKEIVETHKGQLTFTSELGKGSIFTIVLPEYEIKDLSGKIVMVRSNDLIAQFVAKSLELQAIPIVHMVTAEECILALERCNAQEHPVAIYLDLYIKGEITGWDVLDKLYTVSTTFEIPVIIFRSYESYGEHTEYEIISNIIQTVDPVNVVNYVEGIIRKEHRFTLYFSTKDESIIPKLADRGLRIKKATVEKTYMEIELFPKAAY